ncbi:MAG: DUF1800 family protein [Bacteroidota bacterium]
MVLHVLVLFWMLLAGSACSQPTERAGASPSMPTAMQASRMPYIEAGLTEREAAAHLLNRFAYGPRPGDVDAMVNQGLDAWFAAQLDPRRAT